MQIKMRKILAVLSVLAMLCTVLPLGVFAASNDGFVVNGDFETGDLTGFMNKYSGQVQSSIVHGGSYAHKTTNTAQKYQGMMQQNPVKVAANSDYTVTFWYYYEGSNATGSGASFYLYAQTTDNKTNIKSITNYPAAANTWYQATLTFVGQNYGAKKIDRIKRTLLYALIQVSAVGIFIGIFGTIFIKPLARLFVDMTLPSAELIVEAAAVRSRILLPTYFFCGCMETLTAYQRGLGSSLRPMIISLFSICVLRVSWATLIFPIFGTARSLYLVYPLSWLVCALLHMIFCIVMTKKIQRVKTV
jgi:hypothetical protein